jgi:hypothetical protein
MENGGQHSLKRREYGWMDVISLSAIISDLGLVMSG